MHPQTVEFPDMKSIKATKVSAPAAWALMERNLFELMEQSARLFTRKYTERGGGTLLAEDLDGQGHISRAIGTDDRISLFLPLAER